jgi:uncharacterized membrane protein YphA (DoxX/SURF4 family)
MLSENKIKMKKQIILEIICLLYVLLFVYAAVNKLIDVEKFQIQIGKSPLLTPFASWVAWTIPITEILISILLVIPKSRLVGLYASFSLMVMFTAYIVAILNFSSYVPCSCGGVLEKLGWTEHLIFNIAFVLLALGGIAIITKQEVYKEKETAIA